MEQKKSTIYFGIDLGTTNSVISWGVPNPTTGFNPNVIPVNMQLERNKVTQSELLPSCVYFAEDGTPTVGPYARTMIRTQEQAVVKSIKSDMGRSKQFDFHDITYTPAEISRFILKMLADGAETQLGFRPKDVVITVPASFTHDQREATLKAAELAGFQTDGDILLDEPHAALYAFVNTPGAKVLIDFTAPKLVMVFDLGGGTLDVSLHEISEGQNQQLDIGNVSTARYSQIGGDDFDKLLADHFLKIYSDRLPHSLDEIRMGLVKKAFQEYAEEAKTDLGTQFQTRIAAFGSEPDPTTVKTEVLQTPFEDRVFQYELTLNEYEQIIEPLLANHLNLNSVNEIDRLHFDDDNIIYPILDVLAKAKKKRGVLPQIDAVLLNGGMTKLRVIRKRLETFFGPDIRMLEAGDPDKAVALGAAYYHYDVASGTGRYQNKPRILPDTIGLEIAGGTVIPLVEAGTTLPSLPKVYDKLEAKAGANHIELPFYSGRRGDTKPPNRKLLVQRVQFGKPLSKDEPIIIQMQVDEKGILNVDGWLKTEPDQRFTATVGSTQQEETIPAASEKEEKQPPSIPQREVYTLNVKNELSTLRQRLSSYTRQYDVYRRRSIMDQITNQETRIVGADNAEDFIPPLIKNVTSSRERFGKERMTILLGMLATKSKQNNRDSLYDIFDVAMEMSNPEDVSRREAAYVNSVITQAIVTIGKTKLPSAEGHLLHFLGEDMPISVRQSAIYAIGKCCQGINVVKHLEPLIQSQDDSVRIAVNWALGKIGRRERENPLPIAELNSVISQLSTKLWAEPHDQAKQNNIYALGEICDRRSRDLTECVTTQTAGQVLELLGTFQSAEIGTSLSDLGRIRSIAPLQQRANLAIRMIKGEKLSAEEERSLLKIREDD